MDSGSKKLREVDNLPLTDTIVTLACSTQNFAVGCLDDSIYMWNNKFSPFEKDPILSLGGSVTGIIDIAFSKDNKKMATTSMDSIVKILDLDTKQTVSIETPVMSAWKLIFLDENIVTCGDLGHIQFYDLNTKEVSKKIQCGQIFLTSIASSNTGSLLASGNNNGDLIIINFDKKNSKPITFKPHYKMIRSLSFSQDTSKILSGSDDNTLKIFDIISEKVISNYDGHKQTVSCVRAHPTDNKIAFSCSYDKSIRIWDLRMKSCVDTFQSGSALWALEVIGRNIVAGGENGVLSVYSVE